jgi:two-component system copper resistance phosphate regulon response regulator CusR
MHLLIVEDDRQLRNSLTRGLREAGYTADAVGTGLQATASAAQTAYDGIILDILLPGEDGVSVCRGIRATGNRVPILMLTAMDAVEHRIKGLDAGADDYLTKPFDFGELLARVRALTRRHGDAGLATELSVGDLKINTGSHAVRRGRRDIPLTAKEYAFLLHLAKNAGRVVSRAELMSQVWDDPRHQYSNIIDVYASRLRRKIDDGERQALFTTLRGTGYMLAAPENARSTARRGS